MSELAYWKAQYQRRLANGLCTQCGRRLIAGETTKKCEWCIDHNRKKRSLKKNRAADAKRSREAYRRNPERQRIASRAASLRKKLDGTCHDCSNLAQPDSARCRPCADRAAELARAAYREARRHQVAA